DQEVTVSGMSGGTAYVVYVKGETVRVRMADGRRRTTRLENVTPKRESKAASAAPALPASGRASARLEGPMPEPTFGHQPDDPGRLTTCVRCGEPEAWGPMRLCAAHQPAPESWLHHVLRLVDERALLLRLWRGVRRFMARCAGEGM
nr:hypothetical protein [Rhodoglobus sp.]